ncbi:MAG: DUF616 domain-containing protein [Clostridia bacterium]|nr:DUF616 domain-containing protein [Clostridia bacterium]
MDKICVYTCITGNYDKLIEIQYLEKNIDYICFTNNKKLVSNTWNIRYINEDLDNLTLARKIKILGYKYLSEYDLLIWLDGAINIQQPITTFLNDCCDFNNFDMIGFKHKYRNCIYDEINECVRLNKESIEKAYKLEQYLEENNYPRNNGLIESTVLVRKNISEVNKLMDDWFDMLVKFSRRDQLSFNYCLWKNPIRINFLNMYVFDNQYFKHEGHNSINKTNKYRIIFSNSDNFNYKNIADSYFKINNNEVTITEKCKKDTNIIVLELFDEIGSTISNIKINNESKYKLYNVYDLGDEVYFYYKPIILFEGDFKKDSEITITFQLIRNSESDLVNKILNKNNIILELMEKESKYLNEIAVIKNDYENLKAVYEDIVNSREWKVITKNKK